MSKIDFGVNACRIQITMAELIGDRFKGDALIDQPCGTSMAKRVWPVVFKSDAEWPPVVVHFILTKAFTLPRLDSMCETCLVPSVAL